MYRVIFVIFAYLTGASISPTSAVQRNIETTESFQTLEVTPGVRHTMKLPFQYEGLPQGTENVAFIPERFFTTLQDGEDKKAILGPLKPCIFVGLRNNKNGKAVVFHKHYSNSLQSLIDIAKQELDFEASSEISGCLFTRHHPTYHEKRETHLGTISFFEMHQSRTQVEEMRHVINALASSFQIGEGNLKGHIFSATENDDVLGDYSYARSCLIVNSQLQLKSICLMHEKVLVDYSYCPDPTVRELETENYRRCVEQHLLDTHFRNICSSDQDLATYDLLPFVKLTKTPDLSKPF